ncbi:MAG: MBL fold metallo-hydrolase [Christensenellales bacterium]
MKLTCIGRYGPYPKADGACTCYLLSHADKNIVLDLGCGALPKLLRLIRADMIDALILSHLHSDHISDAFTLRYALEVSKKYGRRSFPLPVYMPDSPAAEAGILASHPMIKAHTVADGMRCDISGIFARFALMPHAVPSYAVSLEADGKKFVYSGDTLDGVRLAPFAKGADMLLMEAAVLSKHKLPGVQHVSAIEAGRIGAAAGVKKLIITHIFPEYDESDILGEAEQGFPGAKLAEEFETYEV